MPDLGRISLPDSLRDTLERSPPAVLGPANRLIASTEEELARLLQRFTENRDRVLEDLDRAGADLTPEAHERLTDQTMAQLASGEAQLRRRVALLVEDLVHRLEQLVGGEPRPEGEAGSVDKPVVRLALSALERDSVEGNDAIVPKSPGPRDEWIPTKARSTGASWSEGSPATRPGGRPGPDAGPGVGRPSAGHP